MSEAEKNIVVETWPNATVPDPGYASFHPCVHVLVGKFDPQNPEHQRMLSDALTKGIGQEVIW